MVGINPIQIAMLLKQNGPQGAVMQLVQQNFPNDPTINNLIQMAQNGNTQGIQQFAQNILSQQGKDLNTEMNNLMNLVKGI